MRTFDQRLFFAFDDCVPEDEKYKSLIYAMAAKNPYQGARDTPLELRNWATTRNIQSLARRDLAKWNVYSESGKKLGSHDSEGDAKKQLSAIEANKHSGRSITESDGIFQVRTGSQMILETASKDVAEATLVALDAPLKTWSDEWVRLVEQQRSWQVQMERNTNALLDLFKTGRV